jgi:hypothetical protein
MTCHRLTFGEVADSQAVGIIRIRAMVLIRKLLGVSVVTKSRVGFLVALVALITIGGKIAFAEFDLLQRYSAYICLGLGLAGFLCWGIGCWAEARRAHVVRDQAAPAMDAATQDPLAFLGSSRYWGIILILSAAMLTVVLNYRHSQLEFSVYTRLTITNIVTITNVVTVTNLKPVVTFPPMQLAGVVLNGAQSSAVINGQVLRVGEMLGSVQLVAVDSGHAMMALEGETNVLALRR